VTSSQYSDCVTVVIAADSPSSDDVQYVLQRHWSFLHAPKHTVNGLLPPPPESHHYLNTEELLAPHVSFFSARDNGSVVAVGAIAEIGECHGEIKSMHTIAERRGEGFGRLMLEHLIDVARQRDYARVSLETGSMSDFAPAHALYRALGFVECEAFDPYEPSIYSTFMTRKVERVR
jgi:putative acetyltransferase